jgi:hypothetical protein
VLDVLRLRGIGNRRDDLVQDDLDAGVAGGIDLDGPGGAQEVARRAAPLLALPAVHGELDRVPVTAVERFVLVEEGLDRVRPGRDLGQALEGVAENPGVDHRLLSRPEALDVHAENLLGLEAGVADLEAWLVARVLREEDEHPAVEGLLGLVRRHADREAQLRHRGSGGGGGGHEDDGGDQGKDVANGSRRVEHGAILAG